ncbi:MAG: protein kinase [Polyangiaceae bacterium]
MTAEWGPGTVILGRYRLDSVLGRGGMGSVWRAEHLQLRSPVAVKLLDSAISGNEQMLARFMREAQSAASLRSPHVVQIFDYGIEEGTAFIAMEMLQGESLADRIARLKQLPAEEVIRFLSQVLRAIGKAHESGIVHRDLKPDNIFICADDPEFAKVLDFGVAKVTNGELSAAVGSRTQTGMMIGTPYYMSPEQTQAKEVDARADLWGIAVIAYECLVGSRPFTGDSFGELVIAICTKPVPVPSQQATVPPGFDEWFVKGTQRDRARRFGSAREMADELAKLGDGSSRPQYSTVRNPVAVPMPRPSALPARAPGRVDVLDLTTGQRAVTSKSLSHSGSPRSPAVYVLIAAAVLIIVGVGAFVASGGASAFNKGVVGPESAAASLPALSLTPPASPVTPTVIPENKPAVSAPAIPAATPGVASALPAVPEAAPKPPAARSVTPVTKPEPVKKVAASASAAPKSKDPLPPKNWEF